MWRNAASEPEQSTPNVKPTVPVRKGSAQWVAWIAFSKAQGRPALPSRPLSELGGAEGWLFDDEWPPGHAAAEAALGRAP